MKMYDNREKILVAKMEKFSQNLTKDPKGEAEQR